MFLMVSEAITSIHKNSSFKRSLNFHQNIIAAFHNKPTPPKFNDQTLNCFVSFDRQFIKTSVENHVSVKVTLEHSWLTIHEDCFRFDKFANGAPMSLLNSQDNFRNTFKAVDVNVVK